jgi:hypothetical protein
MKRMARNLTDGLDGFLGSCRYLIHDRASVFSEDFRMILRAAGVESVRLPVRSPNLNVFAERFVRSIKESCLDQMLLIGETKPLPGYLAVCFTLSHRTKPSGAGKQDHPARVHAIPDCGHDQMSKAARRAAKLLSSRGCLKAHLFEFSDSAPSPSESCWSNDIGNKL